MSIIIFMIIYNITYKYHNIYGFSLNILFSYSFRLHTPKFSSKIVLLFQKNNYVINPIYMTEKYQNFNKFGFIFVNFHIL